MFVRVTHGQMLIRSNVVKLQRLRLSRSQLHNRLSRNVSCTHVVEQLNPIVISSHLIVVSMEQRIKSALFDQ